MHSWSLHSVPVRHPSVVDKVVDTEAVLVMPEQGMINVINDVGARVWSLIDGHRRVEEIVRTICEEYNVPVDQAANDVLEFLSQLNRRGAVWPAQETDAGP
ncbi:MAG: PqqD family protein [Ardenticatenia bacterium]|nr:PqqD family protein [Ardenticatenia bacterium]